MRVRIIIEGAFIGEQHHLTNVRTFAAVVAAADEPGNAGRAHLVHEVSDLLFHTLVLLGHHDIPWSDIETELGRRFGISGIVEKESRRADV